MSKPAHQKRLAGRHVDYLFDENALGRFGKDANNMFELENHGTLLFGCGEMDFSSMWVCGRTTL